jgi:DNA-binding MarR family transcriptional regulator
MPRINDTEFDQANEVVRALRRLAMAQRGRKIELLREFDLQAGQDVVLLELHRLKKAGQNELAQAVEVDEPSVTRSIQRLERKGLVRRSMDPTDARRRVVELTPAGNALIPKLRRVYVNFADQAAGVEGSKERKQLMKMLDEVTGRFSS